MKLQSVAVQLSFFAQLWTNVFFLFLIAWETHLTPTPPLTDIYIVIRSLLLYSLLRQNGLKHHQLDGIIISKLFLLLRKGKKCMSFFRRRRIPSCHWRRHIQKWRQLIHFLLLGAAVTYQIQCMLGMGLGLLPRILSYFQI